MHPSSDSMRKILELPPRPIIQCRLASDSLHMQEDSRLVRTPIPANVSTSKQPLKVHRVLAGLDIFGERSSRIRQTLTDDHINPKLRCEPRYTKAMFVLSAVSALFLTSVAATTPIDDHILRTRTIGTATQFFSNGLVGTCGSVLDGKPFTPIFVCKIPPMISSL